MPRHQSGLTGAAGEHYVAFKLSCLGLVAALPRGGAMGVDVLVSNPEGTRTLAIQVKTTEWAMRLRGRGDEKMPHHLEFPLGYKAAKVDNENLLFAFVDLRGLLEDNLVPDVYLVPADYVKRHCEAWIEEAKMVRLHIGVSDMEQFKNNWNLVLNHLQR